ncbi:MAG TPA: ribose 5-phosphate isomerase A [Nitrososphaeraceae archaeon]|nr:ribose 5-phosphate isomerase A [Nitrososphaeraceae archaeon]
MCPHPPKEKLDFQSMVRDAINKHVKTDQILGLGSGTTVAQLVRELGNSAYKKSIKCVATSLQIKIEAEKVGLVIMDAPQVDDVDIVFDGADQIDANFFMIKGGGGALLREKIVMYSAKTVVILADSSKFVDKFTRSVPIEVHPFARALVYRTLVEYGAQPKLRQSESGYPYNTENGNIIFDTWFPSVYSPADRERELKYIPGIIEVGIFSKRADKYYEALPNGSFRIRPFYMRKQKSTSS